MYSREGYRRNSPDKNNPYNIIPSGNISMKGVDHPVLGIDEYGNMQWMMPNEDYQFPGNTVLEIPYMQSGGVHNAFNRTLQKPVTTTTKNNVPYQWSDTNTYNAPTSTIQPVNPNVNTSLIGKTRDDIPTNSPAYNQPQLKQDTRTDYERQRDQEAMTAYQNPTILEQVFGGARMVTRAVADPIQGIGQVFDAVGLGDTRIGQDLGNFNDEEAQYRYRNLNPNIDAGEKFMSNLGEGSNVAAYGATNFIPFESSVINPIVKGLVGKGNYSSYLANQLYTPITNKEIMQFKPVSKVVDKVDDITENLMHLEYAKNYYSKYGYNIPENLAEIAKDSKLTDETIQGLVNQHNTFVRGVSTNWDEIAKKNPEILRHLEGKGIDYINNPQAAAEYMSTHVPIQTGYGRVGLNENVFREGKDAIYTSNSIPTAEGYTYGNGYIVKVKRPTDFSSKNRIDWINSNKLDYFEDGLKTAPKEIKDKFLKLTEERYIKEIEPKYFDKNGKWKNGKVLQRDLNYDNWKMEQEVRQQLGLPVEKSHNLLKTEHNNKSYLEQINNDMLTGEQFLDRIGVPGSTKKMIEITKEVGKKYNPKLIKLEEEIFDIRRKYLKDNVTKKRFGLNDSKIEDKYNDLLHKLKSTREESILNVKQQQLKYLKDNYGDKLNEVDRYAHYLHIGTPSQKLLEPIEAIRITPDIWKNKSRAHTNAFSKGLSAGSLIPFYLYSQSQNQNKQSAGAIGASQENFQQGGTAGMDGMMKARLAIDSHFGNPTAKRMTNYDTRSYEFPDGNKGNVYVSSYDNLVTPQIQDVNGKLQFIEQPWSDTNANRSYEQSMKFEREEDARYFGENYKKYAPMMNLYKKQQGGQTMNEEIIRKIQEALQQGVTPERLVKELQKQGVSEQEAIQMVSAAMPQQEQMQQYQYGTTVRHNYADNINFDNKFNATALGLNAVSDPRNMTWALPDTGFGSGLKAISGLASGLAGSYLGYAKMFADDKINNNIPNQKTNYWDWNKQIENPNKTQIFKEANYNNKPIISQSYTPQGAEFEKGGMKKYQQGDQVMDMTSINQMNPEFLNPEAFNITFNSMYPYLNNTQSFTTTQQEQNKPYNYNEDYGRYKQYLDNFAKQDFSQISKEKQNKKEEQNKPKDNSTITSMNDDALGFMIANNALIGFQNFNDVLSARDYEKEYNQMLMRTGNSDQRYNPINPINPYGMYTPNAGIGSNYGLVANSHPQDFGTKLASAKCGGTKKKYKEGGEYNLTQEEIDYILKNGGEIEMID